MLLGVDPVLGPDLLHASGLFAVMQVVGIERNAFYAAAESAYAIVQTGEHRFYGNILLTKGVIAPEEQA